MITIINKPIYYETTCSKCGCKFRYELSDSIGYWIECPHCKKLNWHSAAANTVYEVKDDERRNRK